MATALVLVNRVRRQLNIGDTTSLGDGTSKVILDRLNGAIDSLFTMFDWDCDIRHDGVLRTFNDQTIASVTVTNGSTTATKSGGTALYTIVQEAAEKGAVLRVLNESDALYPDTAIRVDYGYQNTSSSTSKIVLEDEYLGTTGSVTLRCLANEYALPSTVRKVLSVRHQEGEVRLEEWSRAQRFDRIMQRPNEYASDQPEVVLIGGRAEKTDDAGSAASDASADPSSDATVSMLLYPTPDSEYRIDYTYFYKHPELVNTTDVLANVDRALEDIVAQLAYARCIQSGIQGGGGADNDRTVSGGIAIEERAIALARRLHANQSKDPGRRRDMRGHYRPNRSDIWGRFPRHFGSY